MMGPTGGSSAVISVVISLIVILGFLFAAAFIARRWRFGLRPGTGRGGGGIRIVAVQAVGWQSSLQIVEAEGQRFLIGASRSGITTIGALGAFGAGGKPAGRAPDPSRPPAGSALGLRPKL